MALTPIVKFPKLPPVLNQTRAHLCEKVLLEEDQHDNGGIPQKRRPSVFANAVKPTRGKLVSFQNARFAHPATDVLLLLASAACDPQVGDKAEFLLRYVYYETLSGSLKSFGCGTDSWPDFEEFEKDFRKRSVYGALAGAMFLAEHIDKAITPDKKEEEKVYEHSNPVITDPDINEFTVAMNFEGTKVSFVM